MAETNRASRWIVLSVLAFEAVGALVGGPMLVASPDGRLMSIPVEDLHGAFANFLVPGLLLTALGVLNAAAFVALLRRRPSAWAWVGLALGGFLVWFVTELALVGAKSWAQAAWGIPVVFGIVAALPLLRDHFRSRAENRTPSFQRASRRPPTWSSTPRL